MGVCQNCGKEISDDELYCEDCKSSMELDDSYLDDLLDSMDTSSQIATSDDSNSKEENPEFKEEDMSEYLDFLLNDMEEENSDENSNENLDKIPDDLYEKFDDSKSMEDEMIPEISPEIHSDNDLDISPELSAEIDSEISPEISPELISDGEMEEENKGSDNVFSDALSAISYMEGEEDLTNLIPEEKQEKGKKVSTFKKFFGNIDDDETIEKEKQKLEQEAEASKLKLVQKEERKQKKEKQKEEKKLAKEKSKTEKEQIKKEKKEAKVLKKKQAEEKQEVDMGKINPVGAGIVFGFFAVLCVVIIIGTNLFSYKSDLAYAKKYIDNNNYKKAYEEIVGLDVSEKDKDTYNKIITVMVIQKQWDSYTNYNKLKMYDHAVDSLLKGQRKYNEFYQQSVKLGVNSELSKIHDNILSTLQSEYNISEAQANEIIAIQNKDEYTQKVNEIVNTSNKNSEFN